jgi:GxxExxY protein
MPEQALQHSDITDKIIGAAYEVHGILGQEFMEKVHENALAAELRRAGLDTNQQCPITVQYKGGAL